VKKIKKALTLYGLQEIKKDTLEFLGREEQWSCQ
jgi:hypothetical protein